MTSEDLKHRDDPESALRDARLRFVSLFPVQYTESEGTLERLLSGTAPHEREELIRTFHRMAGLAGIVGFPSVSARARELEELLLGPSCESLDASAARRAFVSLREAFREDIDAPAPVWTAEPGTAQRRTRIVVVEDDPDQRRLLVSRLQNAGHQVFEVDRGDMALGVIRAERPAVVLLDIDLPGTSGLDVCRALKADTDLHNTPVIFLTGRSSPVDRLAGLTVGGDDYLPKPVDATELRLRIDRVARRAAAAVPLAGILGYGQFLQAAVSVLDATRAALALIRIPHEDGATGAAAVEREMRRGDLLGEYDQTHLLALRPDVTAHVAARQLSAVTDALATTRGMSIRMGVSGAQRGGEFRVLLQQADEALAEARVRRVPVVVFGEPPAEAVPHAGAAPVILIAEDDPDVMRVVDSRLQAAGYRTVLAFDGQQALDTIAANAPSMVVLDLMLPRLTGFEVLTALQRSGGRRQRPKIVVVSARGREDDVTRAFQMGADDYMTKPFGPDELVARVARLLR